MGNLPKLSEMTTKEIEKMLRTEKDRTMQEHLTNELACRRQQLEDAKKSK